MVFWESIWQFRVFLQPLFLHLAALMAGNRTRTGHGPGRERVLNEYKRLRCAILIGITILLLLSGCVPDPQVTQPPEPTRDPVLETNFIQELEQIDPQAVPLYQQATRYMDAGDLISAQTLYKQLVDAVPEFSTAYRRLGSIAYYTGDLELALIFFRQAVEIDPNGYNQSALAMALLESGTPMDDQEAYNLALESVKDIPDDAQAHFVLMIAAASLDELEVAKQANRRLLELEPSNPAGHYYAGLLAATDNRWLKAERELIIARKLGVDPGFIQETLDGGIQRNANWMRAAIWAGIGVAIWLLGLGLLFLAGSVLCRATLKAINQGSQTRDFQLKPGERRVRSIYRGLVAILSLYFYISIPFVILLLLGIVGGIFYLFMIIGRIPLQIAAILLVVALASLVAIFRAVFTRRRDQPPGRQIEPRQAPELWSLVEQVARKLAVRPVDAIYLTPVTGIGVNEQGSIFQKLRGGGVRNLILGMGTLSGLTQGEFMAILAHEYGHFSNQDTAGGDLAHQVHASLDHLALRLAAEGAARFYNPVWLFVLGYRKIFLRVTLGASRLQEVLADRYAALAYGGENFIKGLKKVIRQSIAFQVQATHQVRQSQESKVPITNLYQAEPDEDLENEIDQHFQGAMQHVTSQYDSHPAPHERIAWIQRLNAQAATIHYNDYPVTDLLPDPERLQSEMTSELTKNVRILD